MFQNIRIILIHTTHPGNIGAVARAMKNMGFNNLYLVRPKIFPAQEAYTRASGAEEVLQNARVCESLEEALIGCQWAFGLSARLRKQPWPILMAREAAEKIAAILGEKKEKPEKLPEVALVFGQEQSGLLNEELERCHFQIMIPANAEYASLNLAQAVQVITYELRLALLANPVVLQAQEPLQQPEAPLATLEEMEGLYMHLHETLSQIGFLDPKHSPYLMTRLRRLFNRARPDKIELNILRGILTRVQKSV